MAELGFLTPEELFEATKNGMLPNSHESVLSQRKFKKQKEEDIYFPQIFNNSQYNPLDSDAESNDKPSTNQVGRPPSKDSGFNEVRQRRVGSIQQLSIKSVKDVLGEYDNLKSDVNKSFSKKYGINEISEKQKEITKSIAYNISKNYEIKDWKTAIKEVIEKKVILNNTEIEEQIKSICNDFELTDDFMGMLIYHAK